MRTAYLVAVCLVAFSAMGGTITSLDPPSILVSSGEHFMTFNGTNLKGVVKYDGPAGTFELETSADFSGSVVAWVPAEIVNEPGTYTVSVGDSNRVAFNVTKPGRGLLQLHLPELLAAIAKSREGTYIEFDVTATGPSSKIEISCDPRSGSAFPFGQSKIKCTASDDEGNRDTGTIDVNVWDGTAPFIDVPRSFEVQAEDEKGAVVKFDVSAMDDIDGALRVTCSKDSGALFPNGRTTVNCEAFDAAMNPAYGSFDVFVWPRDKGDLLLRTPEKVVEVATEKEGGEAFFEVIAYGSADPDPVIDCVPPSGWFFPMGTTRVICTAYDDFGQKAEASFTVEMVERLELKFPDVNAEAMSPSGAEVAFDAAVDDWKTAITCSPGSGSLFSLGVTMVDCESTDDRGRRAGGSFQVTVADTIAPHIGRVRATAGAASADTLPVQVEVDVTDAADVMPRCSISALTADNAAGFDWRVRSDLEVDVRTGANRAFQIQVTCVDASGNGSTGSVAVPVGGGKRRGVSR